MILARDLLAAMRRLADAAAPREACGLLLGQGGRISALAPTANLAAAADAFEIDTPAHLRLQRRLRGGPMRIVGVWHSHPRSEAAPSARDLAGAWDECLLWAITGTDGTRLWRIEAGRAREL
jgi:proteasome lid subunit RPN8/RPN11